MASKTVADWIEDMSFEVELDGHVFAVDADDQFGGKNRGPRPKGLLLSSLAGCTGMDVVSLLRKMKMEWDSFRLEVEADLSDEHPKIYKDIRINFIFSGDKLDRGKIEKSIKLSLNKYCGVSAMLNRSAQVSYEIILNPG